MDFWSNVKKKKNKAKQKTKKKSFSLAIQTIQVHLLPTFYIVDNKASAAFIFEITFLRQLSLIDSFFVQSSVLGDSFHGMNIFYLDALNYSFIVILALNRWFQKRLKRIMFRERPAPPSPRPFSRHPRLIRGNSFAGDYRTN